MLQNILKFLKIITQRNDICIVESILKSQYKLEKEMVSGMGYVKHYPTSFFTNWNIQLLVHLIE